MDEADWLAVRFEEQRTHLRPVAYRMLGLARRGGMSTSPLSAADRPTAQTKEAPSAVRLAQSARGTVSAWPCEPVRQPAPPTVLADCLNLTKTACICRTEPADLRLMCLTERNIERNADPALVAADQLLLRSCWLRPSRTPVGACAAGTSNVMLDGCGMQHRTILITSRHCWWNCVSSPSCMSASTVISRGDPGRSPLPRRCR